MFKVPILEDILNSVFGEFEVADCKVILPSDFTKKLEKIERDLPEKLPEILNAGGDVLMEGIRRTYSGVIRKGNGDLLRALKKTSPKKSKAGNLFIAVEFSGYDRRKVPNALKARVIESGKNGSIGKGAMTRARTVYVPLANEKMIEKIEEIGGKE